jgi:hypothetical protein
MPYVTVFEITQKPFPWWFSGFGLIFVVIGIAFVLIGKRWPSQKRAKITTSDVLSHCLMSANRSSATSWEFSKHPLGSVNAMFGLVNTKNAERISLTRRIAAHESSDFENEVSMWIPASEN